MKIVAGLGTIEDYEAYVKAGADELFIEYVPYEWQKNHELSMPLNRREVSFVNVNIGSQSELEILAEKIKKTGAPVSIAFNSLNYDPKLYFEIEKIIRQCMFYGFEDYIIADMGLLIYLHNRGISSEMKIHISGEIGEINSYLIKNLKELGATRIIYHRGAGIGDIKVIISKFPEIEHEVFYMNENCHFTGGYCNSIHTDELVPLCKMPYETDFEITRSGLHNVKDDRCYRDGCNIRTARDLYGLGVTHLKIVGRGASTEEMIKCITNTRKEIDLL